MLEEELEGKMVKLYRMQRICLALQKALIVLAIIFYLFGMIPVLLSFLLSFLWGTYLRNKADSLARAKYPFVPLAAHSKNPYAPIREEAERQGDSLTVEILAFNWSSLLAVVAAMVAYLFMLTVGSRLWAWQLSLVLG